MIKIGAKVVSHGRYVAFQMAEVTVPWQMFCGNLVAHRPATGTARSGTTAAVSDEIDDEGRGAPG